MSISVDYMRYCRELIMAICFLILMSNNSSIFHTNLRRELMCIQNFKNRRGRADVIYMSGIAWHESVFEDSIIHLHGIEK